MKTTNSSEIMGHDEIVKALDGFDFGPTGSWKIESDGGLYVRREENADWRYLGAVDDGHWSTGEIVREWFEANAARLAG